MKQWPIPLSPVARAVLDEPLKPEFADDSERMAWIAQEVCARMIARLPLVTEPTLAPVQEPRTAPKPVLCAKDREVAVQKGYTGDVCLSCGSFAMVRTGTCLSCLGCGATSGGCS